mmetsp:Transcript_26505/g.44755  ORF Transcript_26505/g.44755 Transcript_26505/m.44755 type:complete len:212 (-) Transcript_26505:42-677(-)
MNELGGMILGGGLVFVASAMVTATGANSASGKPYCPDPDQDAAATKFNAVHDESRKKNDALILCPKFSSSYAHLKAALEVIDVPLVMHKGQTYATIDLRKFINSSPSFEAERQLQRALIAEGLLMSPGEANGANVPGFFRICVPNLTDAQVSAVVFKLTKVGKTFKWFGNPPSLKRSKEASDAGASTSTTAKADGSSANGSAGNGKKKRTE